MFVSKIETQKEIHITGSREILTAVEVAKIAEEHEVKEFQVNPYEDFKCTPNGLVLKGYSYILKY